MKKIMIMGSGGAGKSTLARKLGDRLNLPVFHLDAYMWKPNWTLSTRAEQQDIQSALMANTAWIIDGNYSGTMDIRIAQADTIIFLDISRRICLYQVIKRYLTHRHTVRPDMAEGCKEKIDREFLQWVWNYPRDKRPAIMQKLNHLKNEKQVIILHSPQQIEQWIHHL